MSRCPRCHAQWASDHLFCPRDGSRLIQSSDEPTMQGTPKSLAESDEGIPQPGDILDEKYKLLRVIGTGGVGVVFEAHHLRIHRSVAIKVLKPEVVGDELQLARFSEEARLAGQIGHEGIIEVFDLVMPETRPPYIVMELLNGESLADLLARKRTLDPVRAITITLGILKALAAAHAREIVHRDVKPANVFLAKKEGRGEVIKLLDFGIARALKTNMRLTIPGRAVGTAVFMPPEQLMASEIDPRADIYTVAAVLYVMLTGEPPFRGRSWSELARTKLGSTVPPLHNLEPAIGLRLEQVLKHGLERAPEDRPSTAEEYQLELEQTLEAIERLKEQQRQQRTSEIPTLIFGEKRRVAVLPFEVSPVDHPDFWVGEGMAISIFDDLASRPGQRVVSQRLVHAARCAALHNCVVSPAAVAHQVGAGYVLTGYISFEGPDPRLEIRIIEVDSGEILARRTQTGPLIELFRLQGATVENIGRVFKIARHGDHRPPPLALKDYTTFRKYHQAVIEAISLRDAPDDDSLSKRFDELVTKYPTHHGMRRHRADLLLRRFVAGRSKPAELDRANEDLEALASWGSFDPWVPIGRARLRATNRYFQPQEALVLADEARVVQGFNGLLMLEQATALETLNLLGEATACLTKVYGQDQFCGIAMVRLARIALCPLLSGRSSKDISAEMLQRAAFLLRAAQRIQAEEVAEGPASISARHGWPPMPDLVALEATLRVRRGEHDSAEALLRTTRPTLDRSPKTVLADTTAWCLLCGSLIPDESLAEVMPLAEALLDGPNSYEVYELALCAPEVWLPMLAHWSKRQPKSCRIRLLYSSLLERSGKWNAALDEARSIATDSTKKRIHDFATAVVERLELKITTKKS